MASAKCKMCEGPIGVRSYTVHAQDVDSTAGTTPWTVCQSCYNLIADECSGDTFDPDAPDLAEADPQMPGWIP